MYDPLIVAFNYALDRLSKVDVTGLPEFKEERQIVFARSDTKCIGTETYLQGSYKPDIILIKWSKFKTKYGYEGRPYSESYSLGICCESGRGKPPLGWFNILSTVEVKRGDSGGAGSEGGVKARSVKSKYAGGFTNLQGDEVLGSSKPQQSAPQKMVDEEHSTHRCMSITPFFFTFSPCSVGTRTGTRSQGLPPSTSDRPVSSQKRRRELQETTETVPKRARSDGVTKPGGTSESGVKPGEPEAEKPAKPQKQAPKIQSAIYASQKMSSSFDISHTINFTLVGTLLSTVFLVGPALILGRHLPSSHLDRSTKRHRIGSYRRGG